MTLMAFFKTTIRLFYQLTVGLTVLLLQIGLLYLLFFLTLAAWIALVGVVTWRTYEATGHHLGWSALACGTSALLCGGLVVIVHRVAKDGLGLTSLSLTELVSLMLLRRRPKGSSQAGPEASGGDRESSRHQSGRPAEASSGAGQHQQVRVVRRVHYASGDGVGTTATVTTKTSSASSSTVKTRSTTITG